MKLALFALALASFGIGTTEFVIMGLLPDVAVDLGVTIPQAGMLVSGYALSVVIGAPVVAILTAKLPRRGALLALMITFIVGNLMCAIAPSYGWLMLARVVTAFCHGAFFGIGAVVAADIVAPHKRAQAIAIMFAGLTIANILGVPFGTAFGQEYGWRSTFWAVVVIGLLAAGALALWLPRGLKSAGDGILHEFRALGQKQVLLAMSISVLASAALFSVFTYIAPLLQIDAGASPKEVTWVLMVFGAGITIGNLLGGKLADWKLMPTIIGLFIMLAVIMSIFAITSHYFWPSVVTVFIWGIIGFGLVSPIQMRILNKAEGAPNLASSMNQGAFNLGNAAGAWIGGMAITYGFSYTQLPWIAVVLAIMALLITVWSYRMDKVPDCSEALPA